jgi:hypothetical protein
MHDPTGAVLLREGGPCCVVPPGDMRVVVVDTRGRAGTSGNMSNPGPAALASPEQVNPELRGAPGWETRLTETP